MEEDQGSLLVEEDQGSLLVEEGQGSLLVEEDQGSLLVEEDQGSLPVEAQGSPKIGDHPCMQTPGFPLAGNRRLSANKINNNPINKIAQANCQGDERNPRAKYCFLAYSMNSKYQFM